MFFVYILYSSSFDKFYVGQTNDLEQRLSKHNSGAVKSTKPYLPWILFWHTMKDSRAEAVELERKLKNLSRQRIKRLIQKYDSAGPDVATGKSGC